ncbi:MAG: response regulator, partial [Microcystaceae cyanobacterium]
MDVSPRVLIIDDSVMVREMLSLTYRKAGYDTEVARDGQDAWEKLRSGLPCDLILCDIEMPRMNGLELLSRLQDDPQLSRIPVAMITSRGAQKMQRLAAEKGAKGYFVKPYIEEALLEASQRLMAGEMLLDVNAIAED